MTSAPESIEILWRRAEGAEASGYRNEADALWRELEAKAPNHPRLSLRRARQFIQARDPASALSALRQGLSQNHQSADLHLELALILRMTGDLAGALGALERALAIEPYNFLALISKGAIVEQMGKLKQAARIYRDALKLAPSDDRLIPALRPAVTHAREIIKRNAADAAAYLRSATKELREKYSGEDLSRFDEGLEIFSGTKKRYVHEPLLLDYPKLPALTYYDRNYFPWLSELEAATPIFQEELEAILREDWKKFRPYIQMPAGAPVNQWDLLNHSPNWSTYFLWRDGARNDANCERCPKSAGVLEKLPLARQPGFSPTAMFSVLQPRTTIPAHTGSTNVRLICHLPLVLPGNCRFRVGNDVREWKMGEAFVFDDSIEHEAWNDSDQIRVVLIFDVWNPLVSQAERELISAMMTARNAYNADDGLK